MWNCYPNWKRNVQQPRGRPAGSQGPSFPPTRTRYCTHRPRAEQAACCRAPPCHRHPRTSRSPRHSGTGRSYGQERHTHGQRNWGPELQPSLVFLFLSGLPSFNSFKLGRHGVERGGRPSAKAGLFLSCSSPRHLSHPPSSHPVYKWVKAVPLLSGPGAGKTSVMSGPAERGALGVGYTGSPVHGLPAASGGCNEARRMIRCPPRGRRRSKVLWVKRKA